MFVFGFILLFCIQFFPFTGGGMRSQVQWSPQQQKTHMMNMSQKYHLFLFDK